MTDILRTENAVQDLEQATDKFKEIITTEQASVDVPGVGQTPSLKARVDAALQEPEKKAVEAASNAKQSEQSAANDAQRSEDAALRAEQAISQTVVWGGDFTPTPANEYPDASTLNKNTEFKIKLDRDQSYTFTGGQLLGIESRNLDTLIFEAKTQRFLFIPSGIKDAITKNELNNVTGSVNNLHTKREAIEWRAGLKVTDQLQLYTHEGIEYLPDSKVVPFTTGATFNADNWFLSELATKGYVDKRGIYFDFISDAIADNSLKLGDYVVTRNYAIMNDGGGAVYKVTNETPFRNISPDLGGGLTLSLQYTQSTINQSKCGVDCRGYPNDTTTALNDYADFCRQEGLDLRFEDTQNPNLATLMYVTSTIDLKGLNVICDDEPAYYNYGVVSDGAGWTVLTGIPTPRPAFDDIMTNALRKPTKGVGIVSGESNLDIVHIDGRKFYNGFGVTGYTGATAQRGIVDPKTAQYQGVRYNLSKVVTAGCGGDGQAFENGLEISNFNDSGSTCNVGYGLTTTSPTGTGGDDNQEYLKVEGGFFTLNKLDGMHIKNLRKGIEFVRVGLNSNGWYGFGNQGLTKPAEKRLTRGGIRIEGVQAIGAVQLTVSNCLAEDSARILIVELDNPIMGVTCHDNYMIPTLGLSNPALDTDNIDVAIYRTGPSAQVRELDVQRNFIQDPSRGVCLGGDLPSELIISARIGPSQSTTFDLNKITQVIKTTLDCNEQIIARKNISQPYWKVGDGSAATFTSTAITDSLANEGYNGTASPAACFLVTTNWQANNSNGGGAYLVWAVAGGNQSFTGSSQVIGIDTGFTSAPTVSSDGVLSVPLAANYRASITRLDMNGYKPTPYSGIYG